jgi:hypothetical protein
LIIVTAGAKALEILRYDRWCAALCSTGSVGAEGPNARFRVQMIPQGNILVLIINPGGQGAVQYQCQMSGRR